MIALTFKNRRYVFVDATARQYTIGVFRISLVEPTVFQLQGLLNSAE